MFYLIGLGMSNGDLTLKGLDKLKRSDLVCAEFYTNLNMYNLKELEKKISKKIKILNRDSIENLMFLQEAANKNIALLVSGDPLTATTHFEMLAECKSKNIDFEIIHSCSIFTIIAETGLSLYKFGRTTTLPKKYQKYSYPESPYEIIKFNLENKMHSLVLLDIGLSAKEALEILEQLDHKKILQRKKLMILCKLGSPNQTIIYDSFENLKKSVLGDLPHSLIIPGRLDDKEQEYLSLID